MQVEGIEFDSNIYFQTCTLYTINNLTKLGNCTLGIYKKDGKLFVRKNDAPNFGHGEDGIGETYVTDIGLYPGDNDVYSVKFFRDQESSASGDSAWASLDLVEDMDREKLNTLIDTL